MKNSFGVLGVALLAACSGANAGEPGGAPAGGGEAGSRLVQQWITGSDGSKSAAGWYDTQLNKGCEWSELISGLWACLPDDVYTIGSDINGLSTFNPSASSDSACAKKDLIALGAGDSCRQYGIVRVLRGALAGSAPTCASSSLPDYYVVTPAPAGTSAYTYGVPAGGGACCSCNAVPATFDRTTLYTFQPLSSDNVGSLNIVTGKLSH